MQYMTIKEAASLWGFNRDHLKRLCQQGVIDCQKIGNMWFISTSQTAPVKYERRK